MNIEPKPNYFSIWRAAFSLFRQHAGLLTGATLCIAAPFFVLSALASARQMMTLGGASMMGVEIPNDQLRVLWGSMVGGEALASIALSTAVFLILKYLTGQSKAGFFRHARNELPLLFRNGGFWRFAFTQVLVFGMINSADGRLKLLGTALFGVSVLILLGAQDREAPAYGRRLRQLSWGGWLSLACVMLTIPLLYIFVNGYVNVLLLMLTDFAVQKIVQSLALELRSSLLPYGVITVSRVLSQWLNLLPMLLLLSTCLALRGAAPACRDT
ncbi:hypothetical protein [Undibacterium sp.]|jgi:hypothetical protein|uniref:hypothetical protein n=1 Tax=Undibacterium sp. TaxID=1914977 RepID=UPI002B8CF06D|nr:hypothetical protein [Undibacterium sp.]HTD03232.1 hypothetical protein [Undibacterium sp.]